MSKTLFLFSLLLLLFVATQYYYGSHEDASNELLCYECDHGYGGYGYDGYGYDSHAHGYDMDYYDEPVVYHDDHDGITDHVVGHAICGIILLGIILIG